MTEDDSLMIRLQEGDRHAFDEIVDKWHGVLIGFFFRNVRDLQLAEDLAQETLLKLHQQFWDYLPVGKFRAWLFRMARNLMIDDIRRRSHDVLVRAVKSGTEINSANAVPDDFAPPDLEVDHTELVALVDELLDSLPADQRLTFTLHHDAGLSLPEVAEIMETSTSTCKSRLRLAREKLAQMLTHRGITRL